MARATYAEVLKALGGSVPTGWTETTITNLLEQTDEVIDAYTAPQSISTTTGSARQIAISVVLRLMQIANFMHQSGGIMSAEGKTFASNLDPLTSDIRERIDRMLTSDTTYGIKAIDMVED